MWSYAVNQSEIDAAILVIFHSGTGPPFTNFSRPDGSTDDLSMKGLEEYIALLKALTKDAIFEKKRRIQVGQEVHSPNWHAAQL